MTTFHGEVKEDNLLLMDKFDVFISYKSWFWFKTKKVEEFHSPEINKAYDKSKGNLETESGLTKRIADHLDNEGSLVIKFFNKPGTYAIPYFNIGNIHVTEKNTDNASKSEKVHSWVNGKLY